LRRKVEADLGGHCVFMQGAAGDMSCNPGEGQRGPQAFGEALADQALDLARSIEAKAPDNPSIAGKVDPFHFASRVDLANPIVSAVYSRSFFPELVRNFVRDFGKGVDAELDTVLLNGELALVGASGEFFCNHANR